MNRCATHLSESKGRLFRSYNNLDCPKSNLTKPILTLTNTTQLGKPNIYEHSRICSMEKSFCQLCAFRREEQSFSALCEVMCWHWPELKSWRLHQQTWFPKFSYGIITELLTCFAISRSIRLQSSSKVPQLESWDLHRVFWMFFDSFEPHTK